MWCEKKQGSRRHQAPLQYSTAPPSKLLWVYAAMWYLCCPWWVTLNYTLLAPPVPLGPLWEKRCYPDNWKYIMYCNAARGGQSHGHRLHAQKIWWSIITWRNNILITLLKYFCDLWRSCWRLIFLLHAACKNNVSTSGLHGWPAENQWPTTSSKLVCSIDIWLSCLCIIVTGIWFVISCNDASKIEWLLPWMHWMHYLQCTLLLFKLIVFAWHAFITLLH